MRLLLAFVATLALTTGALAQDLKVTVAAVTPSP